MTLSSLSIYVVFVDPQQGNSDVMPFSYYYYDLCGAYRSGESMKKIYLQYIYCKVKPRIQRELSHTIKSRCACVWNMVDIYGS